MDAQTHAAYTLYQQRIERVVRDAEVRRRNAKRLAALDDAPRVAAPVTRRRGLWTSPARRRRRRLAADWDLAG